MNRTKIAQLYADAAAFGGKTVTVAGWVKSVRDMKNFGFVTLNDGSCFKDLQVVMDRATLANYDFTAIAAAVLEGLGGKENVASLDNCITRLRIEVKDGTQVNEKKIKAAGVAGVMRPSQTAIQVIIGTKVQFVADEMAKML